MSFSAQSSNPGESLNLDSAENGDEEALRTSLENNDGPPGMSLTAQFSNPDESFILNSAENGDEETVRTLLEKNDGLVWTKAPNTGNTPLHLATGHNYEGLVLLLLEWGANPEVANKEGWKPLAVAARNGFSFLPIAQLLLEYGANVESKNGRLRQSALHLCAETGFYELARILLDHGAQVDIRDSHSKTPLFKAVAGEKLDMIKLLLEYGAIKDIQNDKGVSPEALAAENEDILRLLRTPQLLHGPRISHQGRTPRTGKAQTLIAKIPPPFDDQAKMRACYAFKATVVDFHLGELEQRIQKTVPLYQVIYGEGANSIMKTAKQGQIQTEPSFRWYHLPANNMEWIEALMRRHFAERSPRTAQYTNEFARDLGIGRTRDEHHLMFTSKGSFVRPFCREVKTEHGAMNGRYIAAFVPYLHYEMHRDFQAMADTVAEAIDAWPDMSDGTTGMINNGEGSVKSKKKRPSKNPEKPASARYKPDPSGTQQQKKKKKENKNGGSTKDNASIDTSYIDIPPGILHKMLIQGYLKSGAGGEVPPLQIRRTLDHYFYSHLDNTSKRDSDQVVQRYTSKIMDMEPKMFMVDQLWLWILDNDTVISCCPMRWDSWETDPQAKNLESNTRPGDPSGNMLRIGEDFAVRENDPLNIYQAIAEYMSKIRRDSIRNVEDLCRIITSSCLNAFDPYKVPEEFHFFDFMERSIGDVIEQTTERFEEFQVMLDTAAATNELLSAMNIRIEAETNLLVEIEDIRDELGILRLVIEDQKFVVDDLEKILSPDADEAFHPAHVRKDHILKDNRVLESHFSRIKRMEGLTARAIQSLRSLLKLKQQHASLSEAHSARRLAEYNSEQARLATSYNKLVADQLTMSGKQAKETAKQANVILLFTVVTAVFLPLSFMTSFFTIEIAAFPVDESGKMAMSYVLPIILSVSAGVSIPFILIAFNLDKVSAWPRNFYAAMKDGYEVTTFMTIVCVVIFISLAVVLSQPLATPIKGSIGAALGLLISVVMIAVLIWKKGRRWL